MPLKNGRIVWSRRKRKPSKTGIEKTEQGIQLTFGASVTGATDLGPKVKPKPAKKPTIWEEARERQMVAGGLKRILPLTSSIETWPEADWQAYLANAAKAGGWLYLHIIDPIGCTPGFPDCLLLRKSAITGRSTLIIAELKKRDGAPTDAQKHWLSWFWGLQADCVITRLWLPIPEHQAEADFLLAPEGDPGSLFNTLELHQFRDFTDEKVLKTFPKKCRKILKHQPNAAYNALLRLARQAQANGK